MTNRSKCETCRARKLKCDETRPTCGHCEKTGRKCLYKSDSDPVFVHEQIGGLQPTSQSQSSSASTSRSSSYRSDRTETNVDGRQNFTLRLKRSRKAELGSGEFLMFGRSRRGPSKIKLETPSEADDGERPAVPHRRSTLSPSPSSILSRPQDSLAARWMSVAGTASLSLYPLGNWVKLAWDHVGCNSYLDLAVEYALSAMTAFRHQEKKDFLKISIIGGRAMRSLRQAIMSGTKSIDVYVAIMLHYATEHFRGMQTCYWISHMSAVSQLLASKVPDTDEHETLHSIIHATREDEVMEAILNGQVSLLENLSIPTTGLGSLELDIALSELDRLLVKLPRLVLLVRAARQEPYNSTAIVDAITLAQELYNSNGTLTIQHAMANVMKRTKVAPTTLSSPPVPSSFHFESIPDFVLATRYFILRLLLSGLIQSICELEHDNIPFDRATAERDDLWAGHSIFQCVEWAFKPEHGVRLAMLRMLIPIQLGFGAWDRLLKRQSSSDTPEFQHAIHMRDATIEIANQIDVAWGNRLTAPWRLTHICEMFAGGPLQEWMYNYRSVLGGAMT